MKNLKGFNYADYLKRKLLVGQLDPWRIDDDGMPFYALLVSLETALQECSEWSNQEVTRTDLMNYLKLNNILCLKNINELVEARAERKAAKIMEKEQKKKFTRNISEEDRKARSERMRLIRSSKQPSVSQNSN